MAAEAGAMPEIEAARGSLVVALNAHDAAAIAAAFAADATLLAPGMRMVKGREQIRNFWSSIADRVGEITLTTTDLKPLGGEAARELGRIRMAFTGEQGQNVTSKFLIVWEKSGESWVVESMMWNRIRPPQQGRRPQAGARAERAPAGGVGYRHVPTLYSR